MILLIKLISPYLLMNSARCRQVVERSFDSWNDPDNNRRYRQMKLVLEVPFDDEPIKRTRLNNTGKNVSSTSTPSLVKTPKKVKSKAIKCELDSYFSLSKNAVVSYRRCKWLQNRNLWRWSESTRSHSMLSPAWWFQLDRWTRELLSVAMQRLSNPPWNLNRRLLVLRWSCRHA